MPLLLERNKRRLRDGTRSVDVSVDALGHQRYMATFVTPPQVRKANKDGSIPFIGHASVFDKPARIGGRWGFWERISPGAFTKTIGEADVRFLINHDPNLVLARNTAGTLRLSEDDVGLVTDADMAPTSYGLDLAILLGRGDVTQMSFAFEPVDYRIGEAPDGDTEYEVVEARLYDVSSVTFPAYEDADGGLRGAAFTALCRSQGWDPNQKLEEILTMSDQKRESEYGTTDDGDTNEDPVLNCVTCGANLPTDALFCPKCGGATGAPDNEAGAPAPEGEGGETGRSDEDHDNAEQRERLARARLAMTTI